MNDLYILQNGKDCIPHRKYEELEDAVKRYYHNSSPNFWMWKMFQFGFAYGKHAERQKKARAAS